MLNVISIRAKFKNFKDKKEVYICSYMDKVEFILYLQFYNKIVENGNNYNYFLQVGPLYSKLNAST